MLGIVRIFGALGALWAVGCGAGGGVEQAAQKVGPQGCTLLGCLDGVSYRGDFALNGSAAAELVVQWCRNGSCESHPAEGGGVNQREFSCSGSGSGQSNCSISVKPTGDTASLWMVITPPSGVDSLQYLKDGDVYSVNIGVPGQSPLLSLNTVANYSLLRPNGPECEPLCKEMSLTF